MDFVATRRALLVAQPYNPLTALGSDLLGYWDANYAGTISIGGSGAVSAWRDLVAGYSAAQGTGAAQPVYSATSFGGDPGVTFDGLDDFLALSTVSPFPIGATPCEMWALYSQDAPAADATSRVLYGWGGGTPNSRAIFRVVSSGVNRGRLNLGDGDAGNSVNNLSVDMSGRQVLRAEIGATASALTINGVTMTPVSVVPATANTRFRISSNVASGAASFWQGPIAALLVTNPLTAAKAAPLQNYLMNRRRV